jgi:hypothetical protein
VGFGICRVWRILLRIQGTTVCTLTPTCTQGWGDLWKHYVHRTLSPPTCCSQASVAPDPWSLPPQWPLQPWDLQSSCVISCREHPPCPTLSLHAHKQQSSGHRLTLSQSLSLTPLSSLLLWSHSSALGTLTLAVPSTNPSSPTRAFAPVLPLQGALQMRPQPHPQLDPSQRP